MILAPLFLVPLNGLLNHLGGQSTSIPHPRIVCRVFGMGVAMMIVSLLCGLGIETALALGGIETAGMAFWAVWQWGPGFMAFSRLDSRDYTTRWWEPNTWLTWITDTILGMNQNIALTVDEGLLWGTIYMTLRGGFMYPLFLALAWYLSPWCALFGLVCFAEGIIYNVAGSAALAEWQFGIVFGAAKNLCLFFYLITAK